MNLPKDSLNEARASSSLRPIAFKIYEGFQSLEEQADPVDAAILDKVGKSI